MACGSSATVSTRWGAPRRPESPAQKDQEGQKGQRARAGKDNQKMIIARIVQSASHLDYAARVLDSLETAEAPSRNDYAFGRFVAVGSAVGIIYNSQLINPEYGNFGPRLTTPAELNEVFSPDFLREQGVLLAILLLGWRSESGYQQGVPPEVLPVNAAVETLTPAEVLAFHGGGSGGLRLAYYPTIVTQAKLLAHPLLEAIIGQLEGLEGDGLVTEPDRARLRLLRRSLAWQQTIEGLR